MFDDTLESKIHAPPPSDRVHCPARNPRRFPIKCHRFLAGAATAGKITNNLEIISSFGLGRRSRCSDKALAGAVAANAHCTKHTAHWKLHTCTMHCTHKHTKHWRLHICTPHVSHYTTCCALPFWKCCTLSCSVHSIKLFTFKICIWRAYQHSITQFFTFILIAHTADQPLWLILYQVSNILCIQVSYI